MPSPTTTNAATPTKIHTWIIVLLMWIVALLIFVIGYLVYTESTSQNNDVNTAALADACADVVATQLGTATDATTGETCVSATPDIQTYRNAFVPLAFSYVAPWQIYTFTDGNTGVSSIYMDTNPIWDCTACSGGVSVTPIEITYAKLAAQESGVSAYSKKIAMLTASPLITITKQTATGGTIAWTDNSPCEGEDCSTGNHEVWYMASGDRLYTGQFDDNDTTTTEDNSAWALLLASAVNTK